VSIKPLRAHVTLPFVRPDGSIVSSPGYDSVTGIYADFQEDAIPPVPASPARVEIIAALHTLWGPWAKYPFASAEDRAAMLASIITAVCRPALNTAPAFMFEAPTPGSGKTLAATALGSLVRGRRGGVTPYVEGMNAESELSKQLVAVLLHGGSFLLIDNVVGTWRSAVLAGLITSGAIDGRILGASVPFSGEARLMITATSNNASLDRDLGRRFIRVRIDPRMETPQARRFEFDPAELALRERMAIAHAVLVLIRSYQASGASRLARGGAGFQEWSDLVRNAVLWAGETGVAEEASLGRVGDPAKSISEQAACDDPDTAALSMLLRGLHAHRPGEAFSVRDLFRDFEAGACTNDDVLLLIRDGISGLFPGNRQVSPIGLGKALNFRRERIAGGLLLVPAGVDSTKSQLWRVVGAPAQDTEPEIRR
jgi:hypothetical protein